MSSSNRHLKDEGPNHLFYAGNLFLFLTILFKPALAPLSRIAYVFNQLAGHRSELLRQLQSTDQILAFVPLVAINALVFSNLGQKVLGAARRLHHCLHFVLCCLEEFDIISELEAIEVSSVITLPDEFHASLIEKEVRVGDVLAQLLIREESL